MRSNASISPMARGPRTCRPIRPRASRRPRWRDRRRDHRRVHADGYQHARVPRRRAVRDLSSVPRHIAAPRGWLPPPVQWRLARVAAVVFVSALTPSGPPSFRGRISVTRRRLTQHGLHASDRWGTHHDARVHRRGGTSPNQGHDHVARPWTEPVACRAPDEAGGERGSAPNRRRIAPDPPARADKPYLRGPSTVAPGDRPASLSGA